MPAFAALLTPKGPGAIATVGLCGESAAGILAAIFHPDTIPSPGGLAVGRIADGPETIDKVVLACESEDTFTINCHGSPLVVELLMELLSRHGATAIEAKAFQYRLVSRDTSLSPIAIEAALAQFDSLTVEGTQLIANQPTTGLASVAAGWLKSGSRNLAAAVSSAAADILKRSAIADLIIHGARVVLAGPPNSGKSTLLNCLTGRATSIVTDIPGTTRDYVSARFTIPGLALEVVDTAGLDSSIASSSIDIAAQSRSSGLLESADLILLVLDSTRPLTQFDASSLPDRPIVTVLNKRDVVALNMPGTVSVSAARNENIAAVITAIRAELGIEGFDLASAVCFTRRQENIISQLAAAPDRATDLSLITQLIKGPLAV